jgi:5-formyltetrahydrofolate cyclo-ligase
MHDEEHIKAAKGMLRERVRESIGTLSDGVKAQESERICWVLEGLLRPPRKECMAVFFPLSDEPDILPLIEAMLQAGQSLVAPRMEGKNLVMRRFSSLEELTRSAYGNLEPHSAPVGASRGGPEPAIILVPGRAFDHSCNRLGRGVGFYDRFIASERKKHPKTEFLGVCFSCQLLENIPTLPNDQRVDRVVSPDEIVRGAV